jgi:small subunit ribosomal protein S9
MTPKEKYIYANGKRKTSVARVRLYPGKGEITVNDKPAKEYFAPKTLVKTAASPLELVGAKNKFDISAKITGGGMSSQAEALRHGIAKALVTSDPLNKTVLKKAGLLTRDSRVKERKKFGLKKARKAPQFSKR